MNDFKHRARQWLSLQGTGTNQFSGLLEYLLDILLPRHCVGCGLASGMANLCIPCRAELPRDHPVCRRCGLQLYLSSDTVCGACLRKPPPWHTAIAGLAYRFPVDQLVCRFKFRRDLACGQILGEQLLSTINQQCCTLPELIVPVPLHRNRRLARSFNQAELLARQVGRGLHIQVRSTLLKRTRKTSAQSGLNARDRKRNIKGAFSCRRVDFSHVALVDDVMTTGTTLAECTRVLKRSGVDKVTAWVAARADLIDCHHSK